MLETRGFERLTTNHVARVGGVSIGSVYQYFPAKEALVGAVIESLTDETEQRLTDLLGSLDRVPIEETIGVVVDWYIAHFRDRRRVYRAVLPVIRQLDRAAYVDASMVRISKIVARRIDRFAERRAEIESRAYLLVCTIQASMDEAVLRDDEWLDHPDLSAEVAALALGSLTLSRVPAGGRWDRSPGGHSRPSPGSIRTPLASVEQLA